MIGTQTSDHAAVGAKHLAIDPVAVGTGQESDGGSDVLRRPQALKRIHFRHAVDELLRFSVQEEVGPGRAWRDCVDRDRPAAEFLGEDRGQRFDGRLGRGVHPDYVMTHTLWPRAVDRTDVICEWHFHPTEMVKPDFEADDAVEFWDITNRARRAIPELSQAGIKSRAYKPGPYSRCESLPHAFDQMVLDREKQVLKKQVR